MRIVRAIAFLLLIQQHQGWAHLEPEFVDVVQNITVPVGRDVKFSCHVRHLGANYKVAWIHFEKSAILTVHTHVITRNPRVGVSHENQRTWHLHLNDVQESDRGRYLCQINTAQAKTQSAFLNVVVPPTIDDSASSSDVIVREGSDLNLNCHAKGSPAPSVKWRREDGRKITTSKSLSSTTEVEGSALELHKISRLDMGVYMCIASNGVPPTVSKRIFVSVDFPPMVWVPQQLVGAPVGATVTIECWLEAHPAALHYWARPDGQVLHDPSKYRIESINSAAAAAAAAANGTRSAQSTTSSSPYTVTSNGFHDKNIEYPGPDGQMTPMMNPSSYMTHLKLTIRHLSAKDYGPYRCVAKNPRGETDGTIKIYQTDRTGHVVKTTHHQHHAASTTDETPKFELPATTEVVDDHVHITGKLSRDDNTNSNSNSGNNKKPGRSGSKKNKEPSDAPRADTSDVRRPVKETSSAVAAPSASSSCPMAPAGPCQCLITIASLLVLFARRHVR